MSQSRAEGQSPNLEVISKADPQEGLERRRLPRLNLSGEQFRLLQNGKVFAVTDLSSEGMAFRVIDSADLALFTVGAEINGSLKLGELKYPFLARVRHERSDLVGCQFEWLGPGLEQALARYLDPARLGKELQPAPPPEGGTIFYHGPSGTEFILVRQADGSYQRFTVHVLGSIIQWERSGGLMTGIAGASRERSDNRGSIRFETLLLRADSKPDPKKLEIAKQLLVSSNLPQDLVAWCLRQMAVN
jgi:hypothetical protein